MRQGVRPADIMRCPRASPLALAFVAVLVACGAGDQAAPDPTRMAIAKPDTGSGDAQIAAAGTTLPQDLRVVVTSEGAPAAGVPVIWSTNEGSVSPVLDTTDADGVSRSRWTLKHLFAQQASFASIAGGAGSQVVFTAIGTPDPAAHNTVLVLGEGVPRFEPAAITIAVGDTVNWLWPEGSEGHNVVPDDGDSPPQSGPLRSYPTFHSFRFEVAGIYHYHCAAHGAAGGVGMSGTVTVLEAPVQ